MACKSLQRWLQTSWLFLPFFWNFLTNIYFPPFRPHTFLYLSTPHFSNFLCLYVSSLLFSFSFFFTQLRPKLSLKTLPGTLDETPCRQDASVLPFIRTQHNSLSTTRHKHAICVSTMSYIDVPNYLVTLSFMCSLHEFSTHHKHHHF